MSNTTDLDMTKKSILIRLVFIIILFIALWGVTQWSGMEGEQRQPKDDGIQVEDQRSVDDNTIYVVHTYEDGLHRLEGELTVPTPCHEVDIETRIAESYPEQVMIDFTIVPPEEGRVCTQVLTDKRFTVEYRASEDAIINAALNGESVVLLIDDKAGTLKQIVPE